MHITAQSAHNFGYFCIFLFNFRSFAKIRSLLSNYLFNFAPNSIVIQVVANKLLLNITAFNILIIDSTITIMNTNNYFSKHVVPLAMLLLMLLAGTNATAQNVTIKATNGSTIPARKNGGAVDTFFGLGGFATWQHEQLSMVLTVSDGTKLTQNGQLDNPANNLFKNGNYIQIAKGKVTNANVCYVSLSLPKGFRFTGYTIKFTKPRNAQGKEFNTGNNNAEQKDEEKQEVKKDEENEGQREQKNNNRDDKEEKQEKQEGEENGDNNVKTNSEEK